MIVLQGLHGLSDRETAEPVTSDLRLNAGCGLAINAAGFHPSLTYWRRRLTANDRPQRIVVAPPWGDHGNCWPGSSDGRWIPRPWMMLLPGRTVGSVDRFGPRDRLSWMSCGRPVHHSRCHGQDQNMINFTPSTANERTRRLLAAASRRPPTEHPSPKPRYSVRFLDRTAAVPTTRRSLVRVPCTSVTVTPLGFRPCNGSGDDGRVARRSRSSTRS